MIVRYIAEALAEYEAAASWYDDRDPRAGDDFVQAIERAEWLIAEMPLAWPPWPGARAGVRRYVVPGLLFSIAYEVVGDEIVILAVAHQRRRPGYWHARNP
jgi:toxin ParE1/3/4